MLPNQMLRYQSIKTKSSLDVYISKLSKYFQQMLIKNIEFLFSGIHKMTLSDAKLGMTKEVMATKVLPFLFPLSIENGLTVTQVRGLF
jgi:hypothetical protein